MRAEDVLPEGADRVDVGGASVRKGTIGAFLHNARAWCDGATPEADRTQAERDIVEALPSLRAVGLFEILTPRDARLAALLAEHSAS